MPNQCSPAERRRAGLDAGERHEVDVVDREVLVAIDEVDEAVPDAVDARDVELHRGGARRLVPGAEVERALVREGGVAHAQRHGGEGRVRGASAGARSRSGSCRPGGRARPRASGAGPPPGSPASAAARRTPAGGAWRTRRTRCRPPPGGWPAPAGLPRSSSGGSSQAAARRQDTVARLTACTKLSMLLIYLAMSSIPSGRPQTRAGGPRRATPPCASPRRRRPIAPASCARRSTSSRPAASRAPAWTRSPPARTPPAR